MKVVIIGSGNVATVLGKKILTAGHEIIQVVSRSLNNAQSLAEQLNATGSDNLQSITNKADLYLLCVGDNAIKIVADDLPFNDKLIVHTAGAVSKNVLNSSYYYGVLYPLQSLRKDMKHIPDIPILIDGSSPEIGETLKEFATTWAYKVSIANDEERLKLHVAAVFASNFTNHLFTLTEDFCKRESVLFDDLLPLIKETASRVSNTSPALSQTGPAVRRDFLTIDNHMKVLENHPELKEIYSMFSKSIQIHHP